MCVYDTGSSVVAPLVASFSDSNISRSSKSLDNINMTDFCWVTFPNISPYWTFWQSLNTPCNFEHTMRCCWLSSIGGVLGGQQTKGQDKSRLYWIRKLVLIPRTVRERNACSKFTSWLLKVEFSMYFCVSCFSYSIFFTLEWVWLRFNKYLKAAVWIFFLWIFWNSFLLIP